MNKKQRKWRNRILVALALFAIIFAAEHLLPLADMLGSEAAAVYLLFALYLVPYLIAGHDVLLRANAGCAVAQARLPLCQALPLCPGVLRGHRSRASGIRL